MKQVLIAAALMIAPALEAAPALAQGYSPWQPAPNAPKVPFPVINPLLGLNNALNPNRAGQPAPSPVPYYVGAPPPAAITPPQLPPDLDPRNARVTTP